ncbi:class I SAM-dependent methyltransferase [Amycolatopsis minnesotensis]|uniref:Class I SAM-dependent methyltransferase n=1 Tax=Amycolatopsis minnesotensis TaxID=337894 RepID=A0ABN2RN85_9PSEU
MTLPAPAGNFDPGLLGSRCWLELATGERVALPVERWGARPSAGDELLLSRCAGPTLDAGCGPGRLTGELCERGMIVLGVDVSEVAVSLTHRRGAPALHRSIFDRIPGEGRWRHVLLADGNIGIGGDPANLLARCHRLLAPGGTALVELDPPGKTVRHEHVRLSGTGTWFPWAWLGMDALQPIASQTGYTITWTASTGNRWFAELERP